MVEESESKWMKVSERGNKRAYTNRGSYRGEGDASRHRSARRHDTRLGVQNEQTREQNGQRGGRVEAREEGEIMRVEEQVATLPYQKFQEELANTQADGTDAISNPTDAEQGLLTVQGFLEDQGELDDEDVMEMDEIKAHLLENGIDMDAEDFLENLSEEEAEEVIKGHEEGRNDREEEEMVSVEEEKGPVGGDVAKKQGLRKRLFKPTSSTVGSTKMRVFNALASPRKRAGAKTGTRQGDNSKQMESKGPLNLENGDIPQQGHDRYDGIFIDWNMDCGGAVSLFSGIMIYSIDQSRWQQWDRRVAALKRRIAVWSINGVEVRRRGIMICYGIKVTTAQWWHRQFGFFEWAKLVYVVVRPN
ncbi:hypothetical protein F2Q69_00021195 [Brassica cretica]|uniref:Uncharacterized protein n=1 Tax=Brassica cretica TaxID=69181 RepID=A0A8S9QAB0_BRACR|nr:hypothetical protein F2Q69_00021195 [Brassica cretica]